ncbi:MAG: anthranilate synthase component I [Actinobacteria bacterium]|nr:MAG: anthranilate synthase component I [Actinomycetota bacterium]
MRSTYTPDRDEFRRLAGEHNLIPVYRQIDADLETPVSAFLKLRPGENAFLLESVEGGERLGRYSFLGIDPHVTIECRKGLVTTRAAAGETRRRTDDPLEVVERVMSQYRPAPVEGLPSFFGGAVGYLGYDAVRYFEPRVPDETEDDLGLPEMLFSLTDTIVVFDHLHRRIQAIANAHVNGDADEAYERALAKVDSLVELLRTPSDASPLGDISHHKIEGVSANMTKESFSQAVAKAKDYIVAGDILQVVLSQRLSTDLDADPFDVYRTLRSVNPSPYMFYLTYRDLKLVGSSPEPLVKVEGDRVITRPLAGTRRRGDNGSDDRELEAELLSDDKERAEHVMLVDLGRNDIGRVCAPGSVHVDELMVVERYSHVMHIVSNVVGELRSDKNSFDVLRATFPAGTVSGAPKVRAMEIIDELEPTRRGPYAGVVGYFGYGGSLDACITIRTIVISDGVAHVQAGAGIVADSVPEREYEETMSKASALMRTIEVAHGRTKAAREAAS